MPKPPPKPQKPKPKAAPKIVNPKRSFQQFSISNGKPAITLAVAMSTPDGMLFDPTQDYSYCRICGAVYQNQAIAMRRRWSHKHAKLHSGRQHRQLAMSGLHCTPEALQTLAPLGIIPVSDIVLSNESEHAGLTAPRMPTADTEV